jgi:hypothetical protein
VTIRKPHFFISYCHANTAVLETLVSALRAAGYSDIRWDSGPDLVPQDTHRLISSNVNWCDIVIPIITQEWLESHECRDELVRAHERRRRIIPFRKEDVSNDGPPKIPFFLQEVLFVSWNDRNIKNACKDLIDRLKTINVEPWKQDCYRNIRSIGDEVEQYSGTTGWKSRLSRQILHTATKHLRKILLSDSECSFNVSHESNYLAFAEPIFSESESIIAICIAAISTFWKNTDFRPAVSTYLGNQRKSASSICRLFVFESADEANQYKNILQAHHKAYGEKDNSGVFLCSKDSYNRLIKRWGNQIDNALREDFGLLTFADSKHSLHAVLNQNEFRYREYKPNDFQENRNQLIMEYFDKFKLMAEGEFDERLGVARWTNRWWDEPDEFCKALSRLFADRKGHVKHYVILRPDPKNIHFDDYFYKLVAKFQEDQKVLQIISIHADRRNVLHPLDGRFAQHLIVQKDFEYVLAFEFEDNNSLLASYSHELHSIEREKLYRELAPDCCFNFDKLHNGGNYEEQQKGFAAIEKYMTKNGYIRRYDVRDDEPLSSIVKKRGIPFQYFER